MLISKCLDIQFESFDIIKTYKQRNIWDGYGSISIRLSCNDLLNISLVIIWSGFKKKIHPWFLLLAGIRWYPWIFPCPEKLWGRLCEILLYLLPTKFDKKNPKSAVYHLDYFIYVVNFSCVIQKFSTSKTPKLHVSQDNK